MRYSAIYAMCLMVLPFGAAAQDQQTLADIRQELTILNVEVQKLRRELNTTGTVQVTPPDGSVLQRVEAIEGELRRLTGKTEEMEFRINRVVTDGTNRIGDLEFRLVELEGGDVGALGETSTLGGDTGAVSLPVQPVQDQPATQLADQEQADFERASEALASGDFRSAADQFATFNQTYPGGPLAQSADLKRGEALEGSGDIRAAARAYLDSFSANQTSPVAPEALYRLGIALGRLNQVTEACVMLSEVGVRFPASEFVLPANAQMGNIGCT